MTKNRTTTPATKEYRVYATQVMFQDVTATSPKQAYEIAEVQMWFEPVEDSITLDPDVKDLDTDEFIRVAKEEEAPAPTAPAYTASDWFVDEYDYDEDGTEPYVIRGKVDRLRETLAIATIHQWEGQTKEEAKAIANLMAAAQGMYDKLAAIRDYLNTFFEDYQHVDASTKVDVANNCPIRRLENCIAEIDALLAEARGR